MRITHILAALSLSTAVFAAIGDNAPSIPAGMCTSHPCMTPPDSTYLDAVWAARANATRATGGGKYIFDDANAWSVPAGNTYVQCRRLIVSYMSAVRPGHDPSGLGATYLTKLKTMNKQRWEKTNTITAASWAASVATLTIGAHGYGVNSKISVVDALPSGYNGKQFTVTSFTSTTVSFTMASDPGAYVSGGTVGFYNSNALQGSFCEAMAYDWLYASLDTTTRATWLADLQDWMAYWVSNNTGGAFSPYNDVGYIEDVLLAMPVAIASYLDSGALGVSNLRIAMDWYLNYLLPVWKQRWGPGSSDDTTTNGGGCWHEQWAEYMNEPFGMVHHIGPNLLSWAQATNNYPGLFTVDNPELKNMGYCLIYQQRPDFVMEHLNDHSAGGWLNTEYNNGTTGTALPASLEIIAAAYNLPTLRNIARNVDWTGVVPYGLEPAGFPYLSPDSSANTVQTPAQANGGAGLPLVRNFNDYATFFRTGWTEDDSFASIKCQNHFWSKDFEENGGITLFSRGNLIIRSGVGEPGTSSQYVRFYSGRMTSQSGFIALDSADTFADETYPIIRAAGTTTNTLIPNDGGQRPIGSGWNQASSISQIMQSPYDLSMWKRGREIYNACEVVAFSTQPKYSFVAINDTAAYNNYWSKGTHTAPWHYDQANTSNRTYRVKKHVRSMVWIPRGKSAFVIVYDQAQTTSPSITKKVYLHTVEQPTVSGNHMTVTRNRTTTTKGVVGYYGTGYAWHNATHCVSCSAASTYAYSGQADAWMTIAGNAPYSAVTTPCVVGGAGHEADIGAVCNNDGTVASYGTNWAECSVGQCNGAGNANYGVNNDQSDFVRPDQTFGMQEPGSWRIEEQVGASNLDDWFLNVFVIRDVADSTVVLTTSPVSTDLGNGHWSTTFKYNSDLCTVTVILPKYGTPQSGVDTITATGTCPSGTGGTI